MRSQHHVHNFKRFRCAACHWGNGVWFVRDICGENIDNGGLSTRFHMSNVLQCVTAWSWVITDTNAQTCSLCEDFLTNTSDLLSSVSAMTTPFPTTMINCMSGQLIGDLVYLQRETYLARMMTTPIYIAIWALQQYSYRYESDSRADEREQGRGFHSNTRVGYVSATLATRWTKYHMGVTSAGIGTTDVEGD
jgi:hypothetical protein